MRKKVSGFGCVCPHQSPVFPSGEGVDGYSQVSVAWAVPAGPALEPVSRASIRHALSRRSFRVWLGHVMAPWPLVQPVAPPGNRYMKAIDVIGPLLREELRRAILRWARGKLALSPSDRFGAPPHSKIKNLKDFVAVVYDGLTRGCLPRPSAGDWT